jgi:hypothetical protein
MDQGLRGNLEAVAEAGPGVDYRIHNNAYTVSGNNRVTKYIQLFVAYLTMLPKYLTMLPKLNVM